MIFVMIPLTCKFAASRLLGVQDMQRKDQWAGKWGGTWGRSTRGKHGKNGEGGAGLQGTGKRGWGSSGDKQVQCGEAGV